MQCLDQVELPKVTNFVQNVFAGCAPSSAEPFYMLLAGDRKSKFCNCNRYMVFKGLFMFCMCVYVLVKRCSSTCRRNFHGVLFWLDNFQSSGSCSRLCGILVPKWRVQPWCGRQDLGWDRGIVMVGRQWHGLVPGDQWWHKDSRTIRASSARCSVGMLFWHQNLAL